MIDVIVTGSRNLVEELFVHSKLDEIEREFEEIGSLVEGGCPTGADRFARSWLGMPVARCTFAADWNTYGKSAGPRRNREMLELFPDALVLAFPSGASPGTRNCIKQALALGHTVRIFECDP